MGSCGGAVAVDELERDFGKFVQLEDSEEDVSASSGGDNSDAEVYHDLKDGPQPVVECLGKLSSSALPCGNESSPNTPGKVEDGDQPEMPLQQHLSNVEPQHSVPSLQLVSALKGGREKIGVARRKLSVTWAPDVYDPVPNSLSHTVKGNKKKSRKDKDKDNKKNKKGQKSGKDKKQLRKHGGRSDKAAHRTVDTVSRFVHVSDDLGDFDVGSPDCCGSSFLRESQTKFHFSVAEAL